MNYRIEKAYNSSKRLIQYCNTPHLTDAFKTASLVTFGCIDATLACTRRACILIPCIRKPSIVYMHVYNSGVEGLGSLRGAVGRVAELT